MSIFQPCEGGVFRVENDCSDGANTSPIVFIDTLEGASGSIAFTGFMLELHTNHQFLHSLDEFIYVFPFGDRIGEFTLTGMTFTGGNQCTDAMPDGLCGIYKYYLDYRVSQEKGYKPSQIQIGGCSPPLLGFLTGFRMETLRPELPIVQWVLRYNVIIGK